MSEQLQWYVKLTNIIHNEQKIEQSRKKFEKKLDKTHICIYTKWERDPQDLSWSLVTYEIAKLHEKIKIMLDILS